MPSEPLKLKFHHLDVFTTTPYKGNPLAIVHLPPGRDLDQAKKQSIARDFNLSETVFLHENEGDDEHPTRIDIFTPSWEIPFAGHPAIGTGWHLLKSRRASAVTLLAKAGPIPVVPLPTADSANGGRVKLNVPVNFKVHPSYVHPTLKKNQTDLTISDYVNGSDGQEPIASIVKGMTFLLLQLTSTNALARMIPLAQTLVIPGLGDQWAPFVLLYAFIIIKEEAGDGDVNGVFHIQTRMFTGDFEDPATGSAASTLAGWLALRKGRGKWAAKIVQGVEIGRRSEIEVVVTIGDEGDIKEIELIGSAVQVMEGYLMA